MFGSAVAVSDGDVDRLRKLPAEQVGHYSKARDAISLHTDTAEAPRIVIKPDCNKRARLNVMRYVLNELDYKGNGEDPKNLPPPDPLIIGRAHLNAPA